MKYFKIILLLTFIVTMLISCSKEKDVKSMPIDSDSLLFVSQVDSTISLLSSEDSLNEQQLLQIHDLMKRIAKDKEQLLTRFDGTEKSIQNLIKKVQKFVDSQKGKQSNLIDSISNDLNKINPKSVEETKPIDNQKPISKPKPKPIIKKNDLSFGISYANEKLICDTVKSIYDLPAGHYIARINEKNIVRFTKTDTDKIHTAFVTEDTVTHAGLIIKNHKVLRQIRRLQIKEIKRITY